MLADFPAAASRRWKRALAHAFPAAVLLATAASPAWSYDVATGVSPGADEQIERLWDAALLHTLNAELLGNASATLTLDRWCASRKLAPAGSMIIADRVRGGDRPADASIRGLLQVGPQELVAYRRVRLRCGERVLSEADNWYVPALLTPDMNRTLDTTDTSFGRVVAPLDFRRETLSAKLLWSPASRGSGAPIALPRFVLQHRAVLERADGRPFSALVETYTSEVLGSPAQP